MSAYRSDVAQLERRERDLEDELAQLGADDDVPLARDRRMRDVRVRVLTGVMLLVAGPVVGFWVGAISGAYARHTPEAAALPASTADELPTRLAEVRRAQCNSAVRGMERGLHTCEVDLDEALAGNGVSVVVPRDPDGVAPTLEQALARYAAPVLTCQRGPTRLALRFAPDGQIATVDFDPSAEVAPSEQACVRAVLQPVTVPLQARGISFVATFGLPEER